MEEWNSNVDLPWIRGTIGRCLVLVGQNPIISEVHVRIPLSHNLKNPDAKIPEPQRVCVKNSLLGSSIYGLHNIWKNHSPLELYTDISNQINPYS